MIDAADLRKEVDKLDDEELGPASESFAKSWAAQYAAPISYPDRIEEIRCAFVAGQLFEERRSE